MHEWLSTNQQSEQEGKNAQKSKNSTGTACRLMYQKNKIGDKNTCTQGEHEAKTF